MNTAAATLSLAALLAATGCAHRQWAQALEGDRSIEVRPGEGAGNVALGMGRGKVRRRLGEPAVIDSMSGGELYWTYPELGLSVKFQDHKLDAMYCYSGVRGGYETRAYQPFPGATSEGVTVHTAQREVLETYGRPAKWESDDKAPVPATWMIYGQGLGFCYTRETEQMVYFYVD
jgi:hypothetical protein